MKRFLTSVSVLGAFLAAKPVQAAPDAPALPVAPPLSVELRPEKSAFLLGEPISLEFVARNAGDQKISFISGGDFWGRGPFQVEVRDAAGKWVNSPKSKSGKISGGIFSFGIQTIPAHGEFVSPLFLPHWIMFSKAGRYRITAKRSLVSLLPGQTIFDIFNKPKSYVSVPIEASAEVDVLPPDDKEFGALINRLGNSVLNINGVQLDEDTLKLHSIHDARVVPFLIAEAEQFGFGDSALHALSQYDDEAAFGELKKVATVARPKDTRVVEAGFSPFDPDQLRLSAVRFIAWGKNPRRTEFLLSLRHDPMAEIRLIVAQNLGGLPIERVRAIWREMLNDASAEVRSEAKRRLEQPTIQGRPRKRGGGLMAVA